MRKSLASDLCKILCFVLLFHGRNKESDKWLAWEVKNLADIHGWFGFFLSTDITLYYWLKLCGFCLSLHYVPWVVMASDCKSSLSIRLSRASTYRIEYVVDTMLATPDLVQLPYHSRALPSHLIILVMLYVFFYISINCRYSISALYLPTLSFWSCSLLLNYRIFLLSNLDAHLRYVLYLKCYCCKAVWRYLNSNILLLSQSVNLVNYNTSLNK